MTVKSNISEVSSSQTKKERMIVKKIVQFSQIEDRYGVMDMLKNTKRKIRAIITYTSSAFITNT